MTAYLLVFGLSLTAGIALTALARRLGRRFRVFDHPDGFRKVHKRAVPRTGGPAIFVAFFGALLVVTCSNCPLQSVRHLRAGDFLAMLLGGLAVLSIGLWDDVRGLRARWKLLLTGLVAVGMYLVGFRIQVLSHPFGGSIDLGLWAIPITLFWFLGCMNAINFIDGLDGLAAGVTAFAAGTFFIMGIFFGSGNAALCSLALTGAAFGFLVFNFHPASIYLGDSGSYLLGFLVACLGLRGNQKANMIVALLVPVIALGVPIIDTALAIIRRWARRLPMSSSDRQHIHHKLLELGFSHRQAVLTIYAGCLLLAACALLASSTRSQATGGLLLLLGLLGVLIIRVIAGRDIALATERVTGHLRRRKRGMQFRAAGYEAVERMRQADHLAAVWQVFTAAADRIELDHARLTLASVAETPPIWADLYAFEWARNGNGANGGASNGSSAGVKSKHDMEGPVENGLNGNAAGSHASQLAQSREPVERPHTPEPNGVLSDGVSHDSDALWSATFPLVVGGVRVGSLDVAKATNGDSLEPHVPEVLQLLTAGLAGNIRRVHQNGLSEQAQEALLAAASKQNGQLVLWP